MNFNVSFFRSARIEYKGNQSDPKVKVEFIDTDNNKVIYSTQLNPGSWAEASLKYYVNWVIRVIDNNNQVIFLHKFDPRGKRVYIHFGFPTLGDAIAWFPYVEEFRKKWNCQVNVSTVWRNLFESEYPEILFIPPAENTSFAYATYYLVLGEHDRDSFNVNKSLPCLIPLQKCATDILGLKYAPLRPKIRVPNKPPLVEGKYITVSEYGSHNIEKLWHRPNAWQELVDILSEHYKVVVISREPTKLKNIIDMTNRPIEDTITNLKHSLAFIGVASGLSWLAWAVEMPVIMIGGYSEDWHEFECYRVANRDRCNGCYNKIGSHICHHEPKHECSTIITPKMVFDKVLEAVNA